MSQPPEAAPLLNLGLNRYEAGAYIAQFTIYAIRGAHTARYAKHARHRPE